MMVELGHRPYAEFGVDTDIEAQAAQILYRTSQETWPNRLGKIGEVVVPFDDFSGLRYMRADTVPPGTVCFGNADGVGSKALVASLANKYDTIAFDLMAMLGDDAVIRGGEPISAMSILVVNTLGQDRSRLPMIEALGRGATAAAKEAGVAIINGEIAQHPDMGNLDHFTFDWSGALTWYAHESRLITGFDIKPGDYLVGLREEGLRCNGILLVKTLMQNVYGDKWGDIELEGQRLIDLALKPSRIYSPAIVAMTGGYDLNREPQARLHGAAHITGGGLVEKLGRMLKPSGLGAVIASPFEPSSLMLSCQRYGVTDFEAHRTFNMGQGMVLASDEPQNVINVANNYNIEAKVIGYVTKGPGLIINSHGLERSLLWYPDAEAA